MKIYKLSLFLFLAGAITMFEITCDDRVSEDENTQDYTIIIQTRHLSESVVVGEDVAGSEAETEITATLLNDQDEPVKQKLLIFDAERNGITAGAFSQMTPITDDQGQVVVSFYDGGTAVDDPATTAFEGVILTVSYGDKTASTKFNVYKDKETVWPYQMALESGGVTEILLDNGVTFATLDVTLKNQIENNTVTDAPILITSDKGIIVDQTSGLQISQILTDSTGYGRVVFKDQNLQSDIGSANIIFSYFHPGFDEYTKDTMQIQIGADYNIAMVATPVSVSDNTGEVVVGEDIVGDLSKTRLSVTVTGQDGAPKSDISIPIEVSVLGQSVDQLTIVSGITNSSGTMYAYFEDQESVYQDNPSTIDFEGVTAMAYIGDTTGLSTSVQFEVLPSSVWPYQFYLSTDVDDILLDNGATVATIEARIMNQYNTPVQNLNLTFASDRGFIESQGTTDSLGVVELIFTDNGEQEDIGLANITASYTHPGFNETITDTVFVNVNTSNTLTLEYYPISYDENNSTVIVGEDVEGTAAYTMLVATVKDAAGTNPISGININFQAFSGNDLIGSIAPSNGVSNANGQVVAIFADDGIYQDNTGTPNYEGVTVFAGWSDVANTSVSFNVYSGDDIWPYNIIINSSTDVIQLDNGLTQATITCRLLNNMGNPIINGQIGYQSSRGYIESAGLTDSTGIDSVIFTDLGDPNDVGTSNIQATFYHPGFASELIADSLIVLIEDPSFQACAFMEIPASIPGNIVVRDGGGLEATSIRAEVYDDNGTLINTPTPVVFRMVPMVGDAYLETPGQTSATVYTVNGVATVSINSGSTPGPVRIEATCDCDQDGVIDLTVIDVPVVISSGAPYHIEAEYDPNATEAIGGGFYRTEVAAIVSDVWHNPVEDSTYVYWSIDPLAPDTIIDAFVEGVSFTNNTGISGGPQNGVAYSHIVYSTDAIGEIGRVRALTWGADSTLNSTVGDSIFSYINEDEGDAALFFLPGEVSLLSDISYHDYTLPTPSEYVDVEIAALVIDFYGNPVSGAPVAFGGIGMSEWKEVWYELYEDEGIEFPAGTFGAGDSCFTWRDYGLDDDPETNDWGHFNNEHDAWDTTGNGEIDYSEISEVFYDFGLDGLEGTFDEGEGDGKWDGYAMINCEQVVNTDSDGYARIKARFLNSLCQWNSTDPETEYCTFDDFTAQITATLLIPQITSAAPIEIQLTRSQTQEDCP